MIRNPLIVIAAITMIVLTAAPCLAADPVPIPAVSGYIPPAGSSSTQMAVQVAQPVAVADTGEPVNFSRLDIVPSYMHFMLAPGESKELTVMLRNREDKPVMTRPVARQLPYAGPFPVDSSWVTITPASMEIPAGGSAKYTVKLAIPADELRGSYSAPITFTDEVYPSPYPQPIPNYIHTMTISVDVNTPPVIQIQTPYISDLLETGAEYQYPIEIKNTGTRQISLNPKIGSDSYPMYMPSSPQTSPLSAADFSITGPASISPGSTGTLTLKVRAPSDLTGSYNGYVDLGIDEPLLNEYEGRVQLNFIVWKQPAEAFVKQFSLTDSEPIAIELTSGTQNMMPVSSSGTQSVNPMKDPSFETTLTGPGGDVVLVPGQRVIKGSVMATTGQFPYGTISPGGYQVIGSQYVYTYTVQGKPGAWKLAIMPRNTQTFDYKITLGSDPMNTLNLPGQIPRVTPGSGSLAGNVSSP